MYCVACSSPLRERNAFTHLYTSCANTDSDLKVFYSGKLNAIGDVVRKHSKLANLALASDLLALPSN